MQQQKLNLQGPRTGGGKDLIIRMLAEVFQVNNDNNNNNQFQHGFQQQHRTARWEQVSSSLVPVSLYSRTTSRWLDYLLTASSVANSNANSAMSPDSRDFLLLLQQFHQQNRQPITSQNQSTIINNNININRLNNQINTAQNQPSSSYNGQQSNQYLSNQQQLSNFNNNIVVFQVVAHDFIDGQCRKVLNVKLTQPGTRLGLASDYFVYWKEQQPINNSTIQSSISNNSLIRQQYFSNNNNSSNKYSNNNCCQQQQLNDFNNQNYQQRTWGLNFASVNDAKLFFDICSLNLVDLDFNSDYLKLLALSDRNMSVCKVPTNLMPTPSTSQNQQQLYSIQRKKNNTINHNNMNNSMPYKQDCHFKNNISNKQQHLCQLQHLSKENSINKQLSKCSSCKQEIYINNQQQQQRKRNYNKNFTSDSFNTGSEVCPVHQNNVSRQNSSSIRTRSRSSTRRPITANEEDRTKNESLKRIRSFSTPASPEHKNNDDNEDYVDNSNICPVHHNKQNNRDIYYTQKENQTTHNPKCMNSINKKQGDSIKKQPLSDNQRPMKPARGVLRSDINQLLQVSANEQLIDQMPSNNNYIRQYQQLQNPSKDWSSESKKGFHIETQVNSTDKTNNDQQATRIFNTSRATQRRSTGYDIENIDHFNAHNRNARLARAQYANSKNMKEFLSLDAGGVQSTPTRIAALNDRFDHKPTNSDYSKSMPTNTQQQNTNNKKYNFNDGQHKTKNSNYNQQQQEDQQNNTSIVQNKLNALMNLNEGVDSNDIELKVGGSKNFIVSGETEDLRNVSTTTDDLPLDPLTKKRMFELISEEKSCDKGKTIHSRDDKIGTIGLEPSLETRSRDMRSDIGRRRSLERSTCVDLDSTLPNLKSTSKKFPPCCLSPLPQSTTPQQQYIESSKSSPSNYGMNSNIFQQRHDILQTQPVSSNWNFSGAPKRARTKSSGEGEYCSQNANFQLNSCCNKNRNFNFCHHNQTIDSNIPSNICYKSTQSCYDLRGLELIHNQGQKYNHSHDKIGINNYLSERNNTSIVNSNHGSSLQYSKQDPQFSNNIFAPTISNLRSNEIIMPKISGMSSYAVPLCSEDDRENTRLKYTMRQCQSCPNSLRRKRKEIPLNQEELFHHHDYQQHADNHQIRSYAHGDYTTTLPHISSICSHQNYPRTNLIGDIFKKQQETCSICSNNNLQDKIQDEYNMRNLKNRQQQLIINHCELHGCQCLNKNLISSNSDRTQVVDYIHNQNRPYSSQSTRSPLRFGLYESDNDDEDEVAEEVATNQFPNYNKMNFSQKKVCYDVSREPLISNFKRSNSAYFRPDNIKPVQGYDQTMNRTLLKNRQRAKSQPPGGDQDVSIHLTKSIENVQKLIKEVQNELNIIKCRPISGINSIGSVLDSASSNLKNLNINSDHNCDLEKFRPLEKDGMLNKKDGKNQFYMVSNEENGHTTSSNLNHQLSQSNKVDLFSGGTSSATRKAGQFKCVGAIRKAGFLSVKKWILKRRQSIELARKQGWKRYWVCLRGTTLLFHSVIDKKISNIEELANQTDLLTWIQLNCSNQMKTNLLDPNNQKNIDNYGDDKHLIDRNSIERNMSQCFIEKEPRHLIIIDGAIAQPIPEHPKRDFVFCLSTTFGDAYLFQASCQLESDNWISAIHNACAASIARDFTRDEAIKLFETKIRHLELESEKKLFLRQRLESRLTSMSSMSHISGLVSNPIINNQTSKTELELNNNIKKDVKTIGELLEQQETEYKKLTMRSLLQRLNQQILALDNYIEQLHCEVYQLRCYLSSCIEQNVFYQQSSNNINNDSCSMKTSFHITCLELPHPRSLLMHVSKSTKLLLIKMGIFTVSSFHAYIHARQGSAETILQKIQQASIQHVSSDDKSPLEPVELTIKSRSISDGLNNIKNIELDNDSEELIRLSNLKAISIKVIKILFNKIRNVELDDLIDSNENESDDRYSLHSEGDFVIINLKIHSNTNCLSIIKQVLKIINPKLNGVEFLRYYLRFENSSEILDKTCNKSQVSSEDEFSSTRKNSLQFVAKRRDTLADWNNFEYLELMEKIVFEIELIRKRTDEEASPFGISIGAQLFANNYKNVLNVYCSYIEWGSVADKASIKDDDELLVINGIPVMDLDMMFIECIIRDESKLKLVVRSSRSRCPQGGISLNKSGLNSKSDNDDDDDDDNNNHDGDNKNNKLLNVDYLSTDMNNNLNVGSSQIITDEYISSLVCPPPPAHSNAFLRTDSALLRQKSDLTEKQSTIRSQEKQNLSKLESSIIFNKNGNLSIEPFEKIKAKSNLNLDNPESIEQKQQEIVDVTLMVDRTDSGLQNEIDDKTLNKETNLAEDLLKKTEQLTQLLSRNSPDTWTLNEDIEKSTNDKSKPEADDNNENFPKNRLDHQHQQTDINSFERLKKSIIELIETEYAYVKHLETINEHYMNPLQEIEFLNIQDLKQLNTVIIDLIGFHRDFFDKLKKCILTSINSAEQNHNYSNGDNDEFEDMNRIIPIIDSIRETREFIPILKSIVKTFPIDIDKFKSYTIYCANYSKLQRLLHPKRGHQSSSSTNFNINTIASIPNSLDTFQASSVLSMSHNININNNGSHHREFLKPLGSFITNNNSNSNNNGNNNNNNNNIDSNGQLKQLNKFLNNLDSSSSSASITLHKSSSTSSNINQTNDSSNQKFKISTFNNHNNNNKNNNHIGYSKCIRQQNFESYLIKPIQRIVKYPMLLNSIVISAQILIKDEEVLIKDLHDTVKHMESIASFVNDNQRVYDEYGLIFEHIERQYIDQQADLSSRLNSPIPLTGPHQPSISLNIDQLIYFGTVDWLNIGEFTSKLKKSTNLNQILFVFNSCVVFICIEQIKSTKKKTSLSQQSLSFLQSNNDSYRSQLDNSNNGNGLIRYQSLIPVSEVLVRSVSNTRGNEKNNNNSMNNKNNNNYQWELFRCSSVNSNSSLLTKQSNKRNSDGKVYYLLSSPSNESRSAFLRKIRYIIRESVQNMSLPLARSPSSKSLTPKKLSSPTSNLTNTTTTTTSSSCSQSTSLSPKSSKGDKNNNLNNQIGNINTEKIDAKLSNNKRQYTSGIKVIN